MDAELYIGQHDTEDVTQTKIIQVICDFKPDVVIHAAAMTDVDACELKPDQAFFVNERGTSYVAKGAQIADAVMVYISTDYVFDGNTQTPYEETDQPNPINTYGRSKWAGEQAVRSVSSRYFILRTSWVFGKGGRNFVYSILNWARKQPRLQLVHDKTSSPTYTRDLARIIRQLLNTQAYGLYHVSGQGACTWCQYGQEILKIAGIEKEIIPIPFEELKRPAKRPSYSVLKGSGLEKIGLVMRPWPTALQEFLRNEVL